MNVTIKYSLTTAGQRASLLAGGNGAREQEAKVGVDHPMYTAAVAQANIDSAGNCTVWATTSPSQYLDQVPTVEELLAIQPAAASASAAEKVAEAKKDEIAAQAVLRDRLTTATTIVVGGREFKKYSPAWYYHSHPSVRQSPEALAWQAELDAANAAVDAEITALREAEANAAAAAKEAKAADRAAKRTELGLRPEEMVYRIEDGCLTAVPAYTAHRRGKNWLAIIQVDPHKPGGLDRVFLPKCKGDLFYDVSGLDRGEAVEFGADSYTGGSSKRAERWYGVVARTVTYRPDTEEEAKYLCLVKYDTGKEACKAAAKLAPVTA